MNTRNKNGLIGFGFGVASAFFYEFLILQLIALVFSYMGYIDSKNNPMLSKWQYRWGFGLGFVYLCMFIIKMVSPTF